MFAATQLRRWVLPFAVTTLLACSDDPLGIGSGPCDAAEFRIGNFHMDVQAVGGSPTVSVGDSIQLYAIVRGVVGSAPSGKTCVLEYGPPLAASITWGQIDPDIAEVRPTGWVVGRKEGSTLIHASSGDYVATASLIVEVTP